MRQGLVSSLLDKMADLRANPQVNSNFTFVLVVTGPLLVFLTFYAMQPIKGGRASLRFILTADFVYILFITTLLIRRIVQLAAARRAQSAGSRLHLPHDGLRGDCAVPNDFGRHICCAFGQSGTGGVVF